MSGMSVELRVDVGGADYIPHSFLVVTGPDGIERGYGFAPREGGSLTGDGWIYDDTNHEYSETTGKIPLDDDSYGRLMDYINDSSDNPPPYYLPYGSQCANWAFRGLTASGVSALVSPNMLPDNFLRDLFETIAWNPYTQWLNIKINNLFNAARTTASPLVFDLDGDGIEIAQLSGNSPVLFDHDANGVKTGSAWLKSDDALLVLDRDGNGTIDSGRELFGNNTVLAGGGQAADGYAALGELDSNGDGLIDAQDARFGELRLWRDLDQDGVSDDGELFGLAELGVSQISLAKTAGNQMLADGTRLDGSAGFTVNGETRTYTDAWFAENAFFREFTDAVPLTAEAAALPSLKGAGAVRDLREAASMDASLAARLLATKTGGRPRFFLN